MELFILIQAFNDWEHNSYKIRLNEKRKQILDIPPASRSLHAYSATLAHKVRIFEEAFVFFGKVGNVSVNVGEPFILPQLPLLGFCTPAFWPYPVREGV